MEAPESREFEQTFIEICREHRYEILADLLAILMAYQTLQPDVSVKALGSFEDWSRAVAGPIKWLTGLDLVDARPKAVVDDDKAAFIEFLEIWATDIRSAETLRDALLKSPALQGWAAEHFPKGLGCNVKAVGKFLARFKNMVFDGVRLVESPVRFRGTIRWQLELVNNE